MKLSDAIRLGAMLKPQGYGANSEDLYSDATCALGAAHSAIGVVASFLNPWPWLAVTKSIWCPNEECWGYDCYGRLIVHLNDDHRWTRERIADFVATIEPQDEVVPVEPTAEVAHAV